MTWLCHLYTTLLAPCPPLHVLDPLFLLNVLLPLVLLDVLFLLLFLLVVTSSLGHSEFSLMLSDAFDDWDPGLVDSLALGLWTRPRPQHWTWHSWSRHYHVMTRSYILPNVVNNWANVNFPLPWSPPLSVYIHPAVPSDHHLFQWHIFSENLELVERTYLIFFLPVL